LQEELQSQFKKLNITLSIIPGGCTGYVQVLDVSINKIIKQYLEEYEDVYADEHFDEWKAGKYSVGDCRIPLMYWVAKVCERLHIEYKDTIIKTFRSVDLALNPDGSEDSELSIRDLPNITVGDYTKAPKASVENPIVILDDVDNTIEVSNDGDGYLYTAQEVEGIAVKVENEDDTTTDSSDESDTQFDYDSESEFDDDIDGDEDEDEDME
jgi:hypothetical protein